MQIPVKHMLKTAEQDLWQRDPMGDDARAVTEVDALVAGRLLWPEMGSCKDLLLTESSLELQLAKEKE